MTTTTGNAELPETEAEAKDKDTLLGKLAGKVRTTLTAMNEHADEVERAKAACDRENIKKYGKDWVNRCCG